jgi:hypothetical protein
MTEAIELSKTWATIAAVTTPSAKASGFKQQALALTAASWATHELTPSWLTPKGPVRAVNRWLCPSGRVLARLPGSADQLTVRAAEGFFRPLTRLNFDRLNSPLTSPGQAIVHPARGDFLCPALMKALRQAETDLWAWERVPAARAAAASHRGGPGPPWG